MSKNTKVGIVIIGLPLAIFLVAAYHQLVPAPKTRIQLVANAERNPASTQRQTDPPPPTVLQASKTSDDYTSYKPPTNFELGPEIPKTKLTEDPFSIAPDWNESSWLESDSKSLFLTPPVPQKNQHNDNHQFSLDAPPMIQPNNAKPLSPPERKALPRRQFTQANDSFWLISQRAYGSGRYYLALYEHNRRQFPRPDQIVRGMEIDIPPLQELQNRYPKLCR